MCFSTGMRRNPGGPSGGICNELNVRAQGVYLGLHEKVTRLEPTTYAAWSYAEYRTAIYLDTVPPHTKYEDYPLWDLATRFASSAREMLWLGANLGSADLGGTRAYNFVVGNAHGAVFDGYM
jgi:hypothetical protein